MDRKKERLLACIRIRRFLRLHDAMIYKRFMIMKREKQRKRLLSLSIPVKLGSIDNKNNVGSGNIPTLRLTSDSLNQINKMSSRSSYLMDNAKQQVINSNSNSSLITTPINNDIEGGPTSPNNKSNEDKRFAAQNNTTTSSQDNNPGNRNSSNNNNSSGKHVRNTVTYSDRVKEYLQFGKIITRASNHISNITNNTSNTLLLHKRLSLEKERSQHILDGSPLSPKKTTATSSSVAAAETSSSLVSAEERNENVEAMNHLTNPNSSPDSSAVAGESITTGTVVNEESVDSFIPTRSSSSNESIDSFAIQIVSKPSDNFIHNRSNDDILDSNSQNIPIDSTITTSSTTQIKASPPKTISPKKSLFDMLKHSSMDGSNGLSAGISGGGNIEDGANDDLVSVASWSTTGIGTTILSDNNNNNNSSSTKKFFPLGRYVAETNMDLKHIMSPRSDSASLGLTTFQYYIHLFTLIYLCIYIYILL